VDASDGRHLSWPGCVNFRDAGGYETSTGKGLPRGRIYRSGLLSDIDAATACRIEAELGLRTIVDLRTSMERRIFGSGAMDELGGVDHWHMPLFETIRPDWYLPADSTCRAIAGRYEEMLADGTATVAQLLRRLGKREVYPVLIHCAAGRDRTGIVMALLLSLLGVERDIIAADYALSASLLVYDGGTADPETMRLLLDSVERTHGSVRGFFLANDVTESDLALFEKAVRV
jgi:protein-tyrosine phosphatase